MILGQYKRLADHHTFLSWEIVILEMPYEVN